MNFSSLRNSIFRFRSNKLIKLIAVRRPTVESNKARARDASSANENLYLYTFYYIFMRILPMDRRGFRNENKPTYDLARVTFNYTLFESLPKNCPALTIKNRSNRVAFGHIFVR